MQSRLADLYRPDDPVEVYFADAEDDEAGAWCAAQVVARQHPGVWVRTAGGSLWYVTNSRRIRLETAPDA